MTTLTVWAFRDQGGRAPPGTCVVFRGDRKGVICGDRLWAVSPRDALFSGDGPHVTRLRCRVIGRDDQGDLRCAPGKPTLDYNATKVLRSFARKCTLDRLRVPPRHRPAEDELSFVGLTALGLAQEAARAAARALSWSSAASGHANWTVAWGAVEAKQSKSLGRMLLAK